MDKLANQIWEFWSLANKNAVFLAPQARYTGACKKTRLMSARQSEAASFISATNGHNRH